MRLGDISDFINGGAWSDKAYVEDGWKVVKVTNMIDGSIKSRNDNFLSNDIYEKYIKHRLYTNDLIIATVGSHPSQKGSVVGRTSIVPEEYNHALLNQNAVCIRIKDDSVNQVFFNYLTKTILFKHHIESRAQGSANQVRMALSELKKFSFDYPPLKTQQKIASLLSNYNKLIENNTQRIKVLESMVEELYKEWFVRLRFPGHEDVEVLDSVPEGWERVRLGDIYKTSSGGTPSRKKVENFNGNIPWVKTGELKNLFILDTDESISEIGLKSSSTKLFPPNTVIIAMYCAMPELSVLIYPSATNQACCALLPREDYIHYSFSYMFIKYAQKGLISHAHGAAQQNLSQEIISEYKVIFPSKELLVMYQKNVETIFEEIKLLMLKNQTLKQTRDLLLPRLMSGKLNVEDLDII